MRTPRSNPTSAGERGDDVIAQRSLKSAHGQLVQVLMFRPELTPGRYEEWSCSIKIVGIGDEPAVVTGNGIDAFQSIISALQGVRAQLHRMPPLSWLGALREVGFPLIIPDDDQDFVALIEHLAIVERSRLNLAAKSRHDTRSRLTKTTKKRKGRGV
jgi:hypothetical protein